MDDDQAEKFALWYAPSQIRGAIARAKRRHLGVGWLVKCIKEGWDVDPDPDAAGGSRKQLRIKLLKALECQETFDHYAAIFGSDAVAWASDEEEAAYTFEKAELLKEPHEVTFGRSKGE